MVVKIIKKFIQNRSMRILGVPANRFTYGKDGLYTTHNSEFIDEPSFAKANAKAEATGAFTGIEWRIHVATWAAKNVKDLEGDFVECGVNKGGITAAVIDYVDFGTLNKKFYLFDTFKGLDEKYLSKSEISKGFHLNQWGYEDCYEEVKERFSKFNAVLVKGTIPDTLTNVDISMVAYLHIDLNCAYPEVEALKFFWDKMVLGGVIVLDDYCWMAHVEQKRAIDEFALEENINILSLPTGQGLIVKN